MPQRTGRAHLGARRHDRELHDQAQPAAARHFHTRRRGRPARRGAVEREPAVPSNGCCSRHSRWVLRKLAEWNERRPPPRRWCDGETLMLLGSALTLRLGDAHVSQPVNVVEERDHRHGERRSSRADRVCAYKTGPREQALVLLHDACASFPADPWYVTADLRPVHLSNARTRWGSCHASGRIHLNWRLVQMPLHLIDYVVAHEVAHLLEMNHSQRFWRTVARMVPGLCGPASRVTQRFAPLPLCVRASPSDAAPVFTCAPVNRRNRDFLQYMRLLPILLTASVLLSGCGTKGPALPARGRAVQATGTGGHSACRPGASDTGRNGADA